MLVNVNGINIAYEERGSGVPLLLIHGFPFNRKMWAPQLEGLSRVARVIAPDLRGHGESQALPGPYWMDDLAGDLHAFLQVIGVDRPFVVCGLSMGGYIAMAMYRKYGVHMAGLVLAATRAGPDSEEARQGRDKNIALAREQGVAAVVDGMLHKMFSAKTVQQRPELVRQVRAMMEETSLEGITGALQGMKDRPDSTTTLGLIEFPTLILYGEDDQLVPRSEIRAMEQALRYPRVEGLPDSGHLLNMEQPEHFNSAIERYLQELGLV